MFHNIYIPSFKKGSHSFKYNFIEKILPRYLHNFVVKYLLYWLGSILNPTEYQLVRRLTGLKVFYVIILEHSGGV